MPYEYKRRRPSIIRNFWVYRRLIGTAVLLGLMLWFIWANDEAGDGRISLWSGKTGEYDRRRDPLKRPCRLISDDPRDDAYLRDQAHSEHAKPSRSPQPHRNGLGPASSRLCRQNLGRVSQRSLVKLTK